MGFKHSFPRIFPSLFLLPQMLTGTYYAPDIDFVLQKGADRSTGDYRLWAGAVLGEPSVLGNQRRLLVGQEGVFI